MREHSTPFLNWPQRVRSFHRLLILTSYDHFRMYYFFSFFFSETLMSATLSKNGRKFRDAFVYIFFQASWAKNFDLLRVIAVNGTITIEFYVEF